MTASALVTIAETWYVGQLGLLPLAGMALVFPMVMLQQMLSAGSMGVVFLLQSVVRWGQTTLSRPTPWFCTPRSFLLALAYFLRSFLFFSVATSSRPLVVKAKHLNIALPMPTLPF